MYAATVRENQNIKFVSRLGGEQRLLHCAPRRLRWEIRLEGTAVHREIALPWPQKYPSHRRLAASRS
jgi:hypothetical protein